VSERPSGGILALLREVYAEWSKDNALSLGAALAYYTVFSMAPLLVLVIAFAGLVFGRKAAEGQIVAQLADLLGQAAAETVQGMIAQASRPAAGALATVVSIGTMALGASGVFGQLSRR
jgi:membrane protein